jgi:glutamate-1-semialdehyde 2,1-aminomutase
MKIKKAFTGGTMTANPLSCCAGYFTLEEIDKQNACQKAGQMGDRLTKGLQGLIAKHNLPFVAWNEGSVCHLETVGTMHFAIDWMKPWTIPGVISATSERKKEMQYMGAAYMAEGLVTLAGSRLYTNAQYTPELIDEALTRFDKVFANVAVKEG